MIRKILQFGVKINKYVMWYNEYGISADSVSDYWWLSGARISFK